jgi:hypothetical protein
MPCQAAGRSCGEMPAQLIKDRFSLFISNSDFDAPEENFQLIAADLQPDGLPDLANPDAQRFYDESINDADLIIIIIDNLSTVCRSSLFSIAVVEGTARLSICARVINASPA